MKITYVNRLPKNEEVKNTNVIIENGELIVEVEFEDKFEPKDGDFLTYESCDEKSIFIYKNGIFEDFAGCYCGIISKNRNIELNGELILSDVKCHESKFYCRYATEKEKNFLLEQLEKICHKKWNAEKKCLEDVCWRAKKNEIFYYLDNEGNNVLTGVEDGGIFASMRYESNNYFRTEEAAQKVADQIKEIFKNSKAE